MLNSHPVIVSGPYVVLARYKNDNVQSAHCSISVEREEIKFRPGHDRYARQLGMCI